MMIADTLIVIGMTAVNLGTIQEDDGIQQHTFWLHNTSQQEVILLQGYTSCGCTTINFTKNDTLLAGDTTQITLYFNPRGKGGKFLETGTVVYAADHQKPKHVILSLEGVCITREETLLRQFPIYVNENLRLSTDHFDLGLMHAGETKTRHIVVLHRDEHNRQEILKVDFVAEHYYGKGLQHIPLNLFTMVKGKKIKLTIIMDVVIQY